MCTPSSAASIDLTNGSGAIRATYSDLRVTDATGRLIPSTMYASGGHEVVIRVQDEQAKYPLTVDPEWSQVVEFEAPWYFGTAVAVSGTTAVAGDGSYGDNAYVFSFSDGVWSEVADLTEGPVGGEGFGTSVAVSGSTVVVGDQPEDTAYVFTESGGSWGLASELTPTDGSSNDWFGESVGVSRTNVIVGAPNETNTGDSVPGAVYAFSESGGVWSQSEELAPPEGSSAYSEWGSPVAIDGQTAAIGSFGTDQTIFADVYSLNDGLWSQSGEVPNTPGTAREYSLALSGSTIVVGSPMINSPEGGAYVFTSESGEWSLRATLTRSDCECDGSYDLFGTAVAMSGNTIMVSSPYDGPNDGAGRVYVYLGGGSSWEQSQELTASDGEVMGGFGWSVGVSGPTAFIGAPTWGSQEPPGKAYIFSTLDLQPQGTVLLGDAWGGGSPSEPCQCTGTDSADPTSLDPVDLATGDFTESHTDISVPGAGVPLDFTRTYDAQSAQAEVTNGSPLPPLGYGWSDNLAMSVAYDSSTQTATVTEENGAQTTFNPYVSGTSPAWCTGVTNFCASAPRIEATLNHNTDGTWTYVRTTGSSAQETLTFSSAGALTSVADAAGDTLAASSYSPSSGQTACPSGDSCQVWTSSASGRQLVLDTNSSGQLASVFDPDAGQSVTFAYSGTGCSSWSGSETPDLCSVTEPGSETATFTYDSGNASADFDYDMVTETAPGSSSATTNTYNDQGQISQQTDPSGAVSTLAYAGTNATYDGGTTTVTSYPDGTGSGEPQDVTVYDFSSNVLVGETQGSNGASPTTETYARDPASLLPLQVDDGNGNVSSSTYQTYDGTGGTEVSSANALTSTDAAGNTTQNAYNAFNQAWCTVDPAETADGVTCPTSAPSSPPAPGASDPDLGTTINYYDSSDQLTASTDALGNTTTYAYTSGVSGVPDGLMYCSVDPVDYQRSLTCPAYGAAHVSGTATSTFDAAGDTLTSTNADGDTTTNVYGVSGHPGLVSSTTDPDGTVTSYTYNATGQVLTKVATFGSYSATTEYAYDAQGRRYCEDDPYNYAQGVRCPTSPPSASSPPSGVISTFYDADGHVIQSTNAIGGTTLTAYDGPGNVYCTVTPSNYANGVRCPSSEPTSAPTVGSDSYLGATITSYDANGRVVQVTNPLGGITLTTYDGDNNVLETTVESNDATDDPDVVTTYTYDADDRATSTTTYPSTSTTATTTNAYDPNGDVYCSVSAKADAAGTSAYQCPPWQASWIVSPPSPASLYSSTPSSSQANNVTTTFYNADSTQVQSTNPDVDTTISAVDGDGRTYCTSDPTNVATWLTTNPSGTYPYLCPGTPPTTAPASGSDPGYVTTIFDAAGQKTSSTDQVGDTTTYTYTPGGQTLTTTDPTGAVTTDCYYYEDATGQCANGAPAAGGSADDLYSRTSPPTSADPSGEVTTTTYYPGDQTYTTTTPAGTTTDVYDANGDVTSEDYSGTASGYATPPDVSDTYNADGTRHTMSDGTGTTTYSYDDNGDKTSEALSAASGTGLSSVTTTYGYFTSGALESIAYPSQGGTVPDVSYTYNGAGTTASISDGLGHSTTYSYDADGNETSEALPNGDTSSQTFDNADQLTAISDAPTSSPSSPFATFDSTRNADGLVTAETDTGVPSPTSQAYTYDQASRLTSDSIGSYGYDAAGDPTALADGSEQSFNGADQLTSASTAGATAAPDISSVASSTTATTATVTWSTDVASTSYVDLANSGGAFLYTTGSSAAGTSHSVTISDLTCGATYSYQVFSAVGSASSTSSSATFSTSACSSGTGITVVGATQTSGNDGSNPGIIVALPSGIEAGDEILVTVTTAGSNTPSAPTGYTTVENANDGNSYDPRVMVFAGTASGGETSVYVPTGYCGASASAVVYRGVNATTPIDGVTDGGSGGGTLSVGPITSSVPGERLVLAEGGSDDSWSPPSGWTQEADNTSWSSFSSGFSDVTQPLAGSSGTPTASYGGGGDVGVLLGLEPVTSNTTSYGYDTLGDRTSVSVNGGTPTTLGYDQLGRMVSYASDTTYAYNGDGIRVSKTIGSTTTQETWSGISSEPELLADGSTYYVYGPDGSPLEQVNGSTVLYFLHDQSGSTRLLTNSSGSLADGDTYNATGALVGSTGSDANPLGYDGSYTDTESGYLYLENRYYDPTTGQFLSVDPAVSLTQAPYSYAGDDPVNQSDPTGEAPSPYSTICELFGEIPYIGLTCALNPGGPPTPGSGPYSTSEINSGAIQAQGPDIKVNRGTISVTWRSHVVPSVADGERMLTILQSMLSRTQIRNRSVSFARATRFITQTCPANQGCGPPGRSFAGNPQQPNAVRVDVVIYSGTAFISADNMPGTLAAYYSSACDEGLTYAV